MNTVLCKINFWKKNILNLIKNQIKSNKIEKFFRKINFSKINFSKIKFC